MENAALKEKFSYKNDMMIPKLHKIVLNMGVGEAIADKKLLDNAAADLAAGSDAVILRHPQSVKTIAKMIDALV